MKTFTLMGDPQSIGNAMNKLHKDNPKMKVQAMACGPYMAENPNKLLHGQPAAVPCHVLYVTHDDIDLVDENGTRLAWQDQ